MPRFKQALIAYVKNNKKRINDGFTPKLSDKQLQRAEIASNWKLVDTYAAPYGYEIIYEFHCKPFGDRLVGYIYTNVDKTSIENTIVQGEK